MESEAIGSSKAGEAVSFAREILRALGVTKWIGQKKLDKSIAYATNSRSLDGELN